MTTQNRPTSPSLRSLIYTVHQAINDVPAMTVTNTEYVPEAKRRPNAVVDRHRIIVAATKAVEEAVAPLLAELEQLRAIRDADSIDAAWREVEAVLPEGWWLEQLERWEDALGWRAFALGPEDAYRHGDGSTPAAALRALAAAIRPSESER